MWLEVVSRCFVFVLHGNAYLASGALSLSPQRMQRCQVFHRKLDQISLVVEPFVARQAPDKLLAAIADLDKRLFALDAVLGHAPP